MLNSGYKIIIIILKKFISSSKLKMKIKHIKIMLHKNFLRNIRLKYLYKVLFMNLSKLSYS